MGSRAAQKDSVAVPSSEQLRMRAQPHEFDEVVIGGVDEQEVATDMGFPRPFPLTAAVVAGSLMEHRSRDAPLRPIWPPRWTVPAWRDAPSRNRNRRANGPLPASAGPSAPSVIPGRTTGKQIPKPRIVARRPVQQIEQSLGLATRDDEQALVQQCPFGGPTGAIENRSSVCEISRPPAAAPPTVAAWRADPALPIVQRTHPWNPPG